MVAHPALAGVMTATIVVLGSGLARRARRIRSCRIVVRRVGLPPCGTAPASVVVDEVCPPLRAPARVRTWWHDAGLPDPAAGIDRHYTSWVTAVVIVAVLGAAWRSWPVAIAAPLLGLAGPAVAGWALRDRRRVLVDQQLPPFLDGLTRGLQAGLSLRGAFVQAAAQAPDPLRADLAEVGRALDVGLPFAVAVGRWPRSASSSRLDRGVVLVQASLALVSDAGGARVRAIEGVARTLRDRHAAGREAHAFATQARLSALVIVLAPVAFAAFVAGVDPEAMAFLVTTPPGWGCLATGLVLDSVGAWWMARLSRRCQA